MAAVVQASIATGAGPTLASAEGGIKFNKDATITGTTAPITKPNAAGTNYSWHKVLRFEVTTLDAATSLSNLRIHRDASPSAGLTMFYQDMATTYNQPAVGPADNATTNDATPASYTVMPASATSYDAGSYSAGTTGGKGDYVQVLLGVSNNYVLGAGSNIALPNIIMTYDES